MKSLWFTLAIALSAIVPSLAHASERIRLPANLDPVWHNECTSCHPLYPPKLLTQSDWKALMSNLDKHFGVNATTDDETREAVTQVLVAEASPDSATNHHSETLRITDTPWHLARHKGRRKQLVQRNISNCNNCHKNEDDQLW